MRESFVFHAEFIDDLPEEYRPQFMAYAVNYGIYGIEPDVSGLEKALWLKIKRRIDRDADSWEETKSVRAAAGRLGGVKSGEARAKQNEAKLQPPKQGEANEAKLQPSKQDEANEAKLQPPKQDEANEANEAVHVSVNELVHDDGGEFVSVPQARRDSPPPSPPLSPPQEEYSRQAFEKFKAAGLPCCGGDYFKFISRDFKLALYHLGGISSADVLAAVDNYIAELKKPSSYIDKRYSFDSFVDSKTFRNCLPDNYYPDNFLVHDKGSPRPQEKPEAERRQDEERAKSWRELLSRRPLTCHACRSKHLLQDNSGGQQREWMCPDCRATWIPRGGEWVMESAQKEAG